MLYPRVGGGGGWEGKGGGVSDTPISVIPQGWGGGGKGAWVSNTPISVLPQGWGRGGGGKGYPRDFDQRGNL